MWDLLRLAPFSSIALHVVCMSIKQLAHKIIFYCVLVKPPDFHDLANIM